MLRMKPRSALSSPAGARVGAATNSGGWVEGRCSTWVCSGCKMAAAQCGQRASGPAAAVMVTNAQSHRWQWPSRAASFQPGSEIGSVIIHPQGSENEGDQKDEAGAEGEEAGGGDQRSQGRGRGR